MEESSLSVKEACDRRQEKTPVSYFNNSTIITISHTMTHLNSMKLSLLNKAPQRCHLDLCRVTTRVIIMEPMVVFRGNHSSAMETSWRYIDVALVIKSARKVGASRPWSHNHIITYISPFSLKDHQMCALANIVK